MEATITLEDHFGSDEILTVSELNVDFDTVEIIIANDISYPIGLTLNVDDLKELRDHLSELITKIEEK